MDEKYFSIDYTASINIEAIQSDQVPDLEEIEAQIPSLFMLSDTMEHLDPSTAKNLKKYGPEFSNLVDQVNSYANKINSILCYLMEHEVNEEKELRTSSISGGGFTFYSSNQAFSVDQDLKLKLFFPEYAIAILCYGRVVKSNLTDHLVDVKFTTIRDLDRERIITVVTKHQQKLLRKRAEERNKIND